MDNIDFNKLPNFLLIGAPKCGTTTLHSTLMQNPNIFLPKDPAINFFNGRLFDKGLSWYQDQFFNDAGGYPIRGDSTPSYLASGLQVASRVKSSYGEHEMKFLAIFRDPVKRAYSHYWFIKRRLHEDVTFEDALESESRGERQRRFNYFQNGCYAKLLHPYLEVFPRNRFYFFLLDDLIQDYQSTLQRVTTFLGASDQYIYSRVLENQAETLKSERLFKVLKDPNDPIRRVIRIFTKGFSEKQKRNLKSLFIRKNFRPEKYPPMEKEVEMRLRERYLKEIEEFEKILGRNLDHWKAVNE